MGGGFGGHLDFGDEKRRAVDCIFLKCVGEYSDSVGYHALWLRQAGAEIGQPPILRRPLVVYEEMV